MLSVELLASTINLVSTHLLLPTVRKYFVPYIKAGKKGPDLQI